jgi:hypothetical protein
MILNEYNPHKPEETREIFVNPQQIEFVRTVKLQPSIMIIGEGGTDTMGVRIHMRGGERIDAVTSIMTFQDEE